MKYKGKKIIETNKQKRGRKQREKRNKYIIEEVAKNPDLKLLFAYVYSMGTANYRGNSLANKIGLSNSQFLDAVQFWKDLDIIEVIKIGEKKGNNKEDEYELYIKAATTELANDVLKLYDGIEDGSLAIKVYEKVRDEIRKAKEDKDDRE